jgi:hypothetical protein
MLICNILSLYFLGMYPQQSLHSWLECSRACLGILEKKLPLLPGIDLRHRFFPELFVILL